MAIDPSQVSERSCPRFSVNKLGNYAACSNANTRRRLIHEQKFPTKFIVPRYNQAEEAVKRYIVAGAPDGFEIIEECLGDLRQETPDTAFNEQKRDLCVEALEGFVENIDTDHLRLSGLAINNGESSPNLMTLESLQVSVRPELMSVGNYRRKNINGAIKLYFSKTRPLEHESGTLVATTLHQYIEETLGLNGVSRRHVLVVDVFRGVVYEAPNAVNLRRRQLSASAKEIVALWPTIEML